MRGLFLSPIGAVLASTGGQERGRVSGPPAEPAPLMLTCTTGEVWCWGDKNEKKNTRKPQVKADVRYWWSGRLADTELLPNYRSPSALAAPPAQWQAARGIMASQMQSWKIPLAAGDRERGCHRQSVVRFISVGGPGRNFSIIHRFPCAGGRLDCWPPSLSVCARPGMWGTGRGGGERGRGRCRLF